MKKNNTIRGYMLAILGGVSWGISGVCSQYLFMKYEVSADWLTAVRMLLSGILLLMLALQREHMRVFKIWKERKDVVWLIAFGLAGLLLCQYTFLAAIKYSNSATATVLQSLNVVLMAIVMSVWNKKRMSKIQIAAIILAISGTYLIATKGNPMSIDISAKGLTFGILAAVGVVVYTLLSRPIIASWGNLTITGWGMLIGGMVLFVVTRAWIFPTNLDFPAWIIIAVIVIIGTAVGFSVFLESVKYIGPVKSTLLGCLEPASATILSALVLGTRFTVVELIGFVLVVGTVFLSVSTKE
nr:EamA family transporter [uncultured Blautia sp.]